MTRQQNAYLYAAASVLLWSTVATAFKLSLRHMAPLQLLLWADVVSIGCLGGVLAVRKKFHLLTGYTRKELLRAAGLGILNPFLYYVILFAAYDLLPAQEAQPLNYTWAITLTLLSIPLLKQRIGLREITAILISYSGVVVISTHGNPLALQFSNGLGVALALGSTVIWAFYWIFNAREEKDAVVSLFLNFLFAFPFILTACLLLSDPWPDNLYGWYGAVYVGIFEMGLTFILWLNALKLTNSTARVSTLIFFSPFLSLVFIRIFVGEDIRMATVVGLIFIICGNILQQTAGPEKIEKPVSTDRVDDPERRTGRVSSNIEVDS